MDTWINGFKVTDNNGVVHGMLWSVSLRLSFRLLSSLAGLKLVTRLRCVRTWAFSTQPGRASVSMTFLSPSLDVARRTVAYMAVGLLSSMC